MPVVSQWLFGTKDPSKLSAEQKETLSSIGGLIGAGVGAVSGGGTADIVSGSQAAQNAVNNNALEEAREAVKILENAALKDKPESQIDVARNAGVKIGAAAADGTLGSVGYGIDALNAVAYCLGGETGLCQQARSQFDRKTAEGFDSLFATIDSVMNPETYKATYELFQRAKGGDLAAEEALVTFIGSVAKKNPNTSVLKNTSAIKKVDDLTELKTAEDAAKLAKKGEAFYKTNAEAAKAADAMGYTKIKETVHGQTIFYDGKQYITRDIDAHNGGVWKMAYSVKDLGSKSTRRGTFNADLSKQIGD
ncbi:toxin C-terminal domain-containing protein [Stenoxybacter acetivorans]|uniref:toxin C-terminal domain-containing protein n=1 Tax=Stenoxybacter acetivorans TaxID=422441 RepID=UPI0012EB4B1C|nr:toxin C-terminal domain-containing protein [Stenoxybacter acetivorans]